MEPASHPKSFSVGRRWGIFLSVLVSIAAFVAIMLMLNYLGARHFQRFTWRANGPQKLSPLTLSMVQAITNDVRVIIYYDKNETLYGEISDLLKEYHFLNPKITVESVDWQLDPVTAEKVSSDYLLGAAEKKNLIIVASGGKKIVVPGEKLAASKMERLPDQPDPDSPGAPVKQSYITHLSSFDGESILDGCLLIVTSKKSYLACYTVGHSEPALDDNGSSGYARFASVLQACNVSPREISLTGTNEIPNQCGLLIIAGPTSPAFAPEEINKIKGFLATGGRLLVLFHYGNKLTKLEPLLADWGILVGQNYVSDPDNLVATTDPDAVPSIWVDKFNTKHDLVRRLDGSRLHLVAPRMFGERQFSSNNAPIVTWLARTGPNALLYNGSSGSSPGGSVPLMMAVEKPIVSGGVERGEARIVVAGDSEFLDNSLLSEESNGNEDFARFAVNWLVYETPALQNVGPRRMLEYRLIMTTAQLNKIWWIFLAGMPGGILLFGGLVWLRRRQ